MACKGVGERPLHVAIALPKEVRVAEHEARRIQLWREHQERFQWQHALQMHDGVTRPLPIVTNR